MAVYCGKAIVYLPESMPVWESSTNPKIRICGMKSRNMEDKKMGCGVGDEIEMKNAT